MLLIGRFGNIRLKERKYDTGWLNFSSFSNVGVGSWLDPSRAAVEDGITAVAGLGASSGYAEFTAFLVAKGCNPNVPANAAIDGIEMRFKRVVHYDTEGEGVGDYTICLTKDGVTPVGSNKAKWGGWPYVLAYANYGGANDKWGTTLTPAEVNSANFGVMISAVSGDPFFNQTAGIDHVQIRIHYTA